MNAMTAKIIICEDIFLISHDIFLFSVEAAPRTAPTTVHAAITPIPVASASPAAHVILRWMQRYVQPRLLPGKRRHVSAPDLVNHLNIRIDLEIILHRPWPGLLLAALGVEIKPLPPAKDIIVPLVDQALLPERARIVLTILMTILLTIHLTHTRSNVSTQAPHSIGSRRVLFIFVRVFFAPKGEDYCISCWSLNH